METWGFKADMGNRWPTLAAAAHIIPPIHKEHGGRMRPNEEGAGQAIWRGMLAGQFQDFVMSMQGMKLIGNKEPFNAAQWMRLLKAAISKWIRSAVHLEADLLRKLNCVIGWDEDAKPPSRLHCFCNEAARAEPSHSEETSAARNRCNDIINQGSRWSRGHTDPAPLSH